MLSLPGLIDGTLEFSKAISAVHGMKHQYCSSDVQLIDTKIEFQTLPLSPLARRISYARSAEKNNRTVKSNLINTLTTWNPLIMRIHPE
jgi:hypothetical protein